MCLSLVLITIGVTGLGRGGPLQCDCWKNGTFSLNWAQMQASGQRIYFNDQQASVAGTQVEQVEQVESGRASLTRVPVVAFRSSRDTKQIFLDVTAGGTW